MSFNERRAHKRIVKAYEPEVAAEYYHDLGLIVSPDEVMSYLEQDTYGYPERKILYDSLSKKIKKTYRRTSDRHGARILSTSQEAAFAYEQPREVQTLTQGYHLYLGLLAHKKILKQRLDLPDVVIDGLTPDISDRQAVTKLADVGYEVSPFFANAAVDIMLASCLPSQRLVAMARAGETPPRCEPNLIAAGIGLASMHAAYILRQRTAITDEYRPSSERPR